jgi:protein-tyrosine phosphatase
MDWDNLAHVRRTCPPEHQHKLRRFTEFCLQFDRDVVPDPYFGGEAGFEEVLDLVEDASKGLLQHLKNQMGQAAQNQLRP